ncbi:MAG: DUF5056 domain-containing protein [Prevotellaceae bacterium]|jgi:hypothetical protein|nr:DUF5056 domain-containing protein [Prevotellaceae bacterium]
MTETDNDRLLRQFFDENRHEIADRGFSRRVMHRLTANRTRRLARLWSLFCALLAVVIFVATDAATLIWNALRNILTDVIAPDISQLNPLSVYLAAAVLLVVACRRLAARI